MPKAERGSGGASGGEPFAMDIATILLVEALMNEGGIRRAAASTKRAPSSVSAAVRRFEQAVSIPLFRRDGNLLALTLEARSRQADVAAASTTIRALLATANTEPTAAIPPVGLVALDRFVRIARAGSIRAAARVLGLGQPQLTRQIADLEHHLQCRLFERSHGGIACTKAALDLIPDVERLLDIWARLTRASADRFRRDVTTWRLGAVMPLGPESEIARMLAALTATWHRSRPRQSLFISSTTADELLAGLKSRRFDAALLDIAGIPPDFDGRLVTETPLVLAGPAPALSDMGGDFPRLLATCPIAVPSARSGLRREVTRFLEDRLSDAERRRVTLVEVDSIPVIINLVTHHGYLSVLPETSLSRIHRPPAMIRLGPQYRQSLTLIWPRGAFSSEVGELMISMMRTSAQT
ncbi:DNA-binding transcriptional LysR family regulator [Ensifer adhaerens]|uniref:DNA-binding transcriptional LysR family regulator n=1 Tax=Ensifer adhaerens TaxID=106592 RepID=A0ACC5SZ64_ENSAD|nr:LysR family transcriptional regulator [Ensifer adhaerens]MBP1873689.1 DNA-binding transcriptional LysR family regulator [Ensifer adhaerens]